VSRRTAAAAAVGLAAAAVAGTAITVAHAAGAAAPAQARSERLTVVRASAVDTLLPGSSATGSLLITGAVTRAHQVTDVTFTAATSDTCDRPGLALAPTIAPTPDSPIEVPAGGTATLAWTAYMDGDGEHACQGATLTSEVLLDGEPAGKVVLVAGTLDQPPPPTGGQTTGTRAAVHWTAAPVADPGWVVERAVAGTDAWQPACGSSPSRPVRALTCTDTGLAPGTAYAYRVTLRTGHWHMTSRPGAPVRTQDATTG
jgi:hypothetical protein